MAGDVLNIALATRKFAAGDRPGDADPALALVARAKAGDAEAFDELMALTQRRVVSVAWRMLGNEADARDAAQETFLRVYRNLDRFKPEQSFEAWLYRITVNVCYDVGRKRRRYDTRHEPFDVDSDHGPGALAGPDDLEAEADLRQRREIVARALASLPERERAAVVMRDFEGRTTEEVAAILGTKPVTVRSQISVARAKLKSYCERALRGGRKS
jgi:RNA polymerase sigma-70 factor (ECF subfamily)